MRQDSRVPIQFASTQKILTLQLLALQLLTLYGLVSGRPGYSVYRKTTTTTTTITRITNVRKRRSRLSYLTQSSQESAHVAVGGCLIISFNENTTRLIENLYKEHSFIKCFPFGVELVPRVDGQKIDLFNYLRENKTSRHTYNRLVRQDDIVNGEKLTIGALGCLESHVHSWERVVKLNTPMLILEEGTPLDAGLLNTLFPYLMYLLPRNFGIFYFGNLIGAEVQVNLIDYNALLWKVNGANWGTYAYIISPLGAATLLDFIYPVKAIVDTMIIEISKSHSLDVYISKNRLINANHKHSGQSHTQRYLIPPIIIPRTFHFIYLNNRTLPDVAQRYIGLWRKFHPHWQIFIWTNETIANQNLSLYNEQRLKTTARGFRQASDILRYEIIYEYGGIYIDLDFEPLKSIEALLHGVEAFVAYESEFFICNGIFGATPGHELTRRLIVELDSNWAQYKNGTVNQQTGPYHMTKQVKSMQQENKTTMKDGFQMFAPHIFFPYAFNQRDPGHPYDSLAFAVHHFRPITQTEHDV
ncbi:unnamed protein product [Rotaria magnacalcarata]|uniref:Glycosyl transferase family 25 domain-containing protein n=1 Tax=Rotaria magnacalcarata TaxID=392030 RepID=A0A817A7T4_9BILA|nr:unnamed protein product [Rotaria magnacalcarata]CAF4337952.1 unnamed protein product [Rotaria magnacalcarata]